VQDDTIAASAPPPRRRLSVNTAIFALATGVSRIAGLVREIVAASFFGTSPAASAFTIASQIPNLMSNLFAQAALSAAFVPVFTDLLQQGRKREAFKLASTLFWIILIGLGALTALGIALSGVIMPLFTGSTFSAADNALTAVLAQILFPVVLLLGLTGLLVGILQSYDEFTIPAIAPAVWNLVILVLLVGLRSQFHKSIYAYAVAWLVATVVQLLMVAAALRRIDFRLSFALDWRDPRVRQVFLLMLPVTIGLGIVNLDQLLNSVFGAFVSTAAPRAIDQAFRIYMLPQGVFSVAVATVLFPTLSRQAARQAPAEMRRTIGNGMRQINLLLIPAAALMILLATPITRLVYQRGHFTAASTHLVSVALFWFAFSLPFGGINLLHGRRHHRQPRPVQAAGDRGPGDRHRGGQRGDDGPAALSPPGGLQRADRAAPDADDHHPHPGCLGVDGGAGAARVGAARPAPRALPGRPGDRGRGPGHARHRALRQARAGDADSRGAPDRGARDGTASPRLSSYRRL
jgi:putative peptidoglycan lipid II flippase